MTDPSPRAAPFATETLLAEGRALRALARSLVGDEAADDVVQQTFAAALQPRAAPQRHGAWLHGVVQRLAARWHRGTARRRAREQRAAAAHAATARPDADDPATIAASAELLRTIANAVHALDEPFRTVVVLRFWHDLSTAAIATRLVVPHATVRSRLQRGLARLRDELDARPGGRDAWRSGLLALTPWRGAVRTAPAAVALAATVLRAKMLLGAATASLLAGVAWLAWPVAARTPPQQQPPAPVPLATSDAPDDAMRPAAPPAGERIAATAPAAATPAAAVESNLAVAPWQLLVDVIEPSGRGVPDAVVRVWAGKSAKGGRGISGREDHELTTLRTDARGRATTELDREGVVLRAEVGATRTIEQVVWYTAGRPAVLVVRTPVMLRGRVLTPDGAGCAGAVVTAVGDFASHQPPGWAPSPPPATTDADGCFELPLHPDAHYTVRARWRGADTFELKRSTHRGEPPPAVLTFPGAITVRGVVVDPDGAPVAGARVQLWHADWRDDPTDEEQRSVRSDAHGRFAAAMLRHRRYALLATNEPHAPSDVVHAEPSAERPHVDVRLALQRFASIDGVVQRADGTALAGALVRATVGPLDAAAHPEPERRERFPTGGEVCTDGSGRFALRVHPGMHWTLEVRPDASSPQHRLRRDGVAPGTRDLVIVAHPDELLGCTIEGTTTLAKGEPGPRCDVALIYLDEGTTVGLHWPLAAVWDGGRFRLPTVSTDRLIALHFEPGEHTGLAEHRTEPFRTIAGVLPLPIRLEPWADVAVRVVVPEPHAATRLVVAFTPSGTTPGLGFEPSPIDARGVAHLQRRQPGPGSLAVIDPHREVRDHEQRVLVRQAVILRPGANGELVVAVPASAFAPR